MPDVQRYSLNNRGQITLCFYFSNAFRISEEQECTPAYSVNSTQLTLHVHVPKNRSVRQRTVWTQHSWFYTYMYQKFYIHSGCKKFECKTIIPSGIKAYPVQYLEYSHRIGLSTWVMKDSYSWVFRFYIRPIGRQL